MKIYKSPWVSRESYFIKTGTSSRKNEPTKAKGYIIQFLDGKWQVEEGTYYDKDFKEMPIVAETKTSIKSVIENAILGAVLDATHSNENGQSKSKDIS